MSEKRRNNKNRILKTGESQRPDGRYVYKYLDDLKKPQFVYSWKLVPTDRTPTGKKDDLSLREKIDKIQLDKNIGVNTRGGETMVLDLVKRYITTKHTAKPTTKANYKTVVNILAKEEFAHRKVKDIEYDQAMNFLTKLQEEDGRSYSTIHNIRGVLRPAFKMAVLKKWIAVNPFNFELKEAIFKDYKKREALSREQMRRFLDFVKDDKHFCKYYDGIYILFHTGLRISEFVGLTTADLDMENKVIRVNHQLQRKSDGTKYIETPKTKSGERRLPMEQSVYECFQRILANRKPPKVEPVIDGYSGFLFFDKDDRPMVAMHWEKYFQHIVTKYNKIYKQELPKITPHICRHTYCTNKIKDGYSPNAVQFLMGHSSVSTTLGKYTHIEFEDVCNEMQRIETKKERGQKELKTA